jgi:hypothetical protein
MAFFNNEMTAVNIPDIPVEEAAKYDVDLGGVSNIIMESYEDQLEIVKAMHAADMAELRVRSVYESTDSVDDEDLEDELEKVQEASVGEIFEKIKDAVKKFFAKIKAFFKNIYEKLFVFSKSNKSFAEKYTKVVDDLDVNVSVSFNGYTFKDPDKLMDLTTKVAEAAAKIVESADKKTTEVIDKFNNYSDDENASSNGVTRAKLLSDISNDFDTKVMILNSLNISSSNVDDSTTISTHIYNMYRGESKSSISYNKAKVLADLDILKDIDVKPIKKSENTLEKDFNKILSTISKAEKSYRSASDKTIANHLVDVTRIYNSKVTRAKSTTLTTISTLRTILTEFATQTKSATITYLDKAREVNKEKKKREKNKK